MDETELKADTIILGERNYASALDLVIATAKQELLIFDQDLTLGDYTSPKRFELLQQFLSAHISAKATLILHDEEFLSKRCPRLISLLTTYNHKMTVYITNQHAKIAKDSFVIADKQNYIRRFHADQSRFKYAIDDIDTCASLIMRFEELKEETTGTFSVTQIGL